MGRLLVQVLLRYGTIIGDVAYQEQAATAVENPTLAEQFRAAAALSAAAVHASQAASTAEQLGATKA